MNKLRLILFLGFTALCTAPLVVAEQPADLASGLKPLASILAGKQAKFDIAGRIEVSIDGKPQPIEVSLVRYDDQSFDLQLTHADYAVSIRRRNDVTALMPLLPSLPVGPLLPLGPL